jgi:hypothetical protein
VDPTGTTLYAAACVYALTAEACPQEEVARWSGDRALDLLKEAVRRGYGRDRALDDPDLASVRARPGFHEALTARPEE